VEINFFFYQQSRATEPVFLGVLMRKKNDLEIEKHSTGSSETIDKLRKGTLFRSYAANIFRDKQK